jgi:hypothetical protein
VICEIPQDELERLSRGLREYTATLARRAIATGHHDRSHSA